MSQTEPITSSADLTFGLQMNMSKVGNQTNSNDPQAVQSRVFVGNLNTYQVGKEDVERIFKRYGRIAAISMHKGFAFVQYTNPYDARNSVVGEDGSIICGQTLDVNMVTEPKQHQTGRKRQNLTNTGNDWDYYYDSYSAMGHQRMTPPMKRARIGSMGNQKKTKTSKSSKTSSKGSPHVSYNQLNSYTNPDVLICGNCKDSFATLQKLVDHKKTKCRLRYTCQCEGKSGRKGRESDEPSSLSCVACKEKFFSAWDLVVHVQATHDIAIYEPTTDSASEEGGNGHHAGGGDGDVEGSVKDDEDDEPEEAEDEEERANEGAQDGSGNEEETVWSNDGGTPEGESDQQYS